MSSQFPASGSQAQRIADLVNEREASGDLLIRAALAIRWRNLLGADELAALIQQLEACPRQAHKED